jgi:hypothetical protein
MNRKIIKPFSGASATTGSKSNYLWWFPFKASQIFNNGGRRHAAKPSGFFSFI